MRYLARGNASRKRLTAIFSIASRHFRRISVLYRHDLSAERQEKLWRPIHYRHFHFSNRAKLDRSRNGQKKYTVRGAHVGKGAGVSFFARVGNSESAFVFFNVSAGNGSARFAVKDDSETVEVANSYTRELSRTEVKHSPRLNLLVLTSRWGFDLRRKSYIVAPSRIDGGKQVWMNDRDAGTSPTQKLLFLMSRITRKFNIRDLPQQ